MESQKVLGLVSGHKNGARSRIKYGSYGAERDLSVTTSTHRPFHCATREMEENPASIDSCLVEKGEGIQGACTVWGAGHKNEMNSYHNDSHVARVRGEHQQRIP